MNKIKYFKEWVYVDGYIYNLKTKQLVYLNSLEVNKEFFQSENFNKLLVSSVTKKYVKSKIDKILALEITDDCNYGCSYCFEGNNCQIKNSFLDYDIACNAIDKLPTNSQIRFFGGEPLLNFNLIKKIVEKYPQHYYSIVTNGSLITRDIAKFFAYKNFSVGISYDGSGWQEKNRISKKYNSQKDFEKAIMYLSEAGAYIGVSTVITKESIPYLYDIHLEVFDDYPIDGWAYLIGYTPSLTLEDLDIFKENLFGIINDFPASHLLKINDLKKWSMKITGEWPLDSFCGAGSCYSAITSKGEERFCPFFLRESSCCGPNIGLKEVNCKKCSIWNFCKGGCLALNLFGSGYINKSHPFSCKKNHIYFEAGLKTRIKIRKEVESI